MTVTKLKIELVFFLAMVCVVVSTAQKADFNKYDNICYCAGNSPSNVIKLDNNWELLLSLIRPKTIGTLDSINIKHTGSQLKLLEEWSLIKKGEIDYRTSIVILDSVKTNSLRSLTKKLSLQLTNVIKPKIVELSSQLKKINREENVYSILFSYVIDGMVWDYLEEEQLVNPRKISLESPFWDGEFWSLYPKRDFYCGTNSISDKGYSIKVNWSEEAIPNMIPFVTRFDLQEKMLSNLIEKGRLIDKEAFSEFGKFNFFDEKGLFTAPVIVENEQNPIYAISQEISENIVRFIKTQINVEIAMKKYGLRNTSQAIIVLYHEMIWDIMDSLVKMEIIEKPIAFKNPKQTNPEDIGDLIILVKNK